MGKEENDLSGSVYHKNIKAAMSSWREEAQTCHNNDLKSHFLGNHNEICNRRQKQNCQRP